MRDIKGFGHSHAMHAGVACGSTVTSILRILSCALYHSMTARTVDAFRFQAANIRVSAAKLQGPLSTLHFEITNIPHGRDSFEKNNYCTVALLSV